MISNQSITSNEQSVLDETLRDISKIRKISKHNVTECS